MRKIVKTAEKAQDQDGGALPMSAGGRSRGAQVEAQLQAIESSCLAQLRTEWRRLFDNDPPRVSRDLLVRAVAYRVQEKAFGGLSRASTRQLHDLAKDRPNASAVAGQSALLQPGARLVREWHGRTHVVTVTEAGFDYSGASYTSLTEIAKLITGAHWSGPRFFGLSARRTARESADV